MLTNTLNTNEIKNAAGTEVEFTRLGIDGRTSEFKQITETPALPNRLKISHRESGSGTSKRRQSLVRFDKTTAGEIDTTVEVRTSFYLVGDIPVGNLSTTAVPKDVLAQLVSFVASLGASTTILYDGTGNGADVLLNGGL